MKRYGLGNAQTIKFQYKHENIVMSDYYSKNAELARMHDVLLDEDLIALMEEEGIRMGIDAYDEIFNKTIRKSKNFYSIFYLKYVFITSSNIPFLAR